MWNEMLLIERECIHTWVNDSIAYPKTRVNSHRRHTIRVMHCFLGSLPMITWVLPHAYVSSGLVKMNIGKVQWRCDIIAVLPIMNFIDRSLRDLPIFSGPLLIQPINLSGTNSHGMLHPMKETRDTE